MTTDMSTLTTDLTPDLTSTTDSQDSILTPHQYNAIKWSLVALQVLVCLFGLVTNIVNIIVFGKMGVAESAVSLTLFSLAVADLGFLVTYFIFLLITVALAFELDLIYHQSLSISVWSFLYKISTAITVYLSLQKMFCVAIPFTFKNVFTLRRTVEVLMLTTVIIAGFYVPMFASYYIGEFKDPLNNTTRRALAQSPSYRGYRDIQEIAMEYVLPFSAQIIVIICLVVLVTKLSRASNFRRRNATTKTTDEDSANSGASGLSGKELQAVQAVVLVSAMFVTCNLPPMCSTLAMMVEPEYYQFGSYFR
ncbi:uncharacterized protein LOC101851448 [Aplysia californica]|uniref:Uncharacterized protein LOC101851448 n=1 Tax=Aplysia californica TaxID=6500 RepID=A0ABM0K669_APLCA|nr:uncharacterized protein LOC101851448 [Aplysia californica]